MFAAFFNGARLVKHLGLGKGLFTSAQIVSGKPRLLRVRTPGGVSYLTKNDNSQFHHIVASAKKIEKLANEVPASAKSVLDLGGNVGLFSLLVARRLPNCRIVCVEADPELAAIAKENLRNAPNATVIAAAIDLVDGQKPFYILPGANQVGSFAREAVEHFAQGRRIEVIDVPTVSFPRLVAEAAPVDFMKIDIQGHESKPVSGSLESFDKIEEAAFEVTFFDDDVFRMIDLLRKRYPSFRRANIVLGGADVIFS